jgi:hypothetical protein
MAHPHPTVVVTAPCWNREPPPCIKTCPVGKVGLSVRVPKSPEPDPGGRWETIRYALDSNARTIRLCFILLISSSVVAAAVAGLLPHLLSRL